MNENFQTKRNLKCLKSLGQLPENIKEAESVASLPLINACSSQSCMFECGGASGRPLHCACVGAESCLSKQLAAPQDLFHEAMIHSNKEQAGGLLAH